MTEPNPDTLNLLDGKMLGDLGGPFNAPTVRIGRRLGLFESLHADGAATSTELAARLGLAERYVRWRRPPTAILDRVSAASQPSELRSALQDGSAH